MHAVAAPLTTAAAGVGGVGGSNGHSLANEHAQNLRSLLQVMTQ